MFTSFKRNEHFFRPVRLFVVLARRAPDRFWPQMFRHNMDSEHHARLLVRIDAVQRQNAHHASCLHAHCIHTVLRTHVVHEQHAYTQHHGHHDGIRTMLHSHFCHSDIRWHTAVARHSNNSVRAIRIQPCVYEPTRQRDYHNQNNHMDMVLMDRIQH